MKLVCRIAAETSASGKHIGNEHDMGAVDLRTSPKGNVDRKQKYVMQLLRGRLGCRLNNFIALSGSGSRWQKLATIRRSVHLLEIFPDIVELFCMLLARQGQLVNLVCWIADEPRLYMQSRAHHRSFWFYE